MPDYSYLVVDASSSENLCELPLRVDEFSYAMNAAGDLNAELPVEHPAATEANLRGDREITVLRDGVAVWNGPITNITGSRRENVLHITAREASWYFTRRVLEVDKVYTDTDVFDIVRDIEHYMENKQATGDDGSLSLGDDIVASLPRFGVIGDMAGVTIDRTFYGSARHLISDIFDALVADPDNGIDYRIDYRTDSTRQSCHRTLVMGCPALGVTQNLELTEHLLYDYSRTLDWERGANRVHVRGSGGYVKTLQNAGQVADGVLLLESVFDLPDEQDHAAVDKYAREARRVAQPPIHDRSVSFVPGVTLPFGWCDLGDTILFNISGPALLQITAQHRRVVGITVHPPVDGDVEIVELSTNITLDQLGD